MSAPRPGKEEGGPGTLRRTMGNTAWLTTSMAATRILAYVQFVLVVRAFSDVDVGIYAVCLTAVLFAELLANLGLDRVVVREVARMGRPEAGELFESSLLLKTAAALAAYALCLGVFWLVYPEIVAPHGAAVASFLAYVPVCALARSFESHFTAMERMAVPAVGQFAERLVMLAAGVAAWMGFIGFDMFLAVFPLAAVVRTLVPGIVFLAARERGPLRLSRSRALGLVSQSSWMFGVEIVAVAYFRLDIFMLSKMVDLGGTGLYQAAYKVFDFFIAMFTGYLTAIFPAMARNDVRLRPSMLALGTAVVFVVFSVPVIALRTTILGLFRPEYIQAAPVLTCLMLALPLVYANSMLANFAVASHRVRTLFAVAVPMLAVNVGLNLGLIPRFGILGSALAT
ncbi:MAG: oligosaccharide flippase family protein, partial [Desulfovibrio sp.]|nr:oligosaccharide flippase family protein [Desulfovibrio sp.]